MANLSGGGTGLPVYFTGRRLRNATILPLTQNTDGSFAKGTSGDLCTAQTVRHVRFSVGTTRAEISPSNNTVENDVVLKNHFSVEIGEIMLADLGTNITPAAYGAYDYFLVTAMESPDGGTTKNYIQAIISRGEQDIEFASADSTITFSGQNAGQNIATSVATPTWT